MPTKKTKPKKERPILDTAEAHALYAAGKDIEGKVTQKSIADALDVGEAMVWQMLNRRRPVPWDKAETIARLLKVEDPATISTDYAAHRDSVTKMPVTTTLRPELIDSRVANDIDALRYALEALASSLVEHLPNAARDAADALRATAPEKFLARKGSLHSLLLTLDEAKPKAKGRATAPPVAKP